MPAPYPSWYDDPQICEVCGNDAGDCTCPECPVCGVQGDPSCYTTHMVERVYTAWELCGDWWWMRDFECQIVGGRTLYEEASAKDGRKSVRLVIGRRHGITAPTPFTCCWITGSNMRAV